MYLSRLLRIPVRQTTVGDQVKMSAAEYSFRKDLERGVQGSEVFSSNKNRFTEDSRKFN